MKRLRMAGMVILALALPAAAQSSQPAQPPWPRNPTPERVTFFGGVGGMFPVGKFADTANAGVAPIVGGYLRVNEIFAPAFLFQYGFLDADRQLVPDGQSIAALNLLTGLRLFIPVKSRVVHPWVTGLAGWAHYHTDRQLPLQSLFGLGKTDRDDVMLSTGGGLDFQLHPNFSLGIDTRVLFSISTDSSHGEDNLTAMTVSGMASLHF